MDEPLISVLVATFNYGSTLDRALRSLAAQSLPASAFEVIVVDDGSNDQTADVARSHEGSIRFFPRPHHGLPAACNFGIAQARAPYLVRVDSDDSVAASFLKDKLD